MTRLWIWSHNNGSKGARALAENFGVKLIKHEGSKAKPNAKDVLLNWGDGGGFNIPRLGQRGVADLVVLNKPEAVRSVANKLKFFQAMGNDGLVPQWTTNKAHARKMIEEGHIVVIRTIVNGSGGAGIIIAEKVEDLIDAPLYVQYVPKKTEYRVHLFRGQIIDRQEKARKLDHPAPNWRIRNLAGGFIYKRNNIEVPQAVDTVASDCFNKLQLDFGAVDVVYNSKLNKAYVLEINSAPGLEGQTVDSYVEAIKKLL